MKKNLVIKPRPSDFLQGDGHITFKAISTDWSQRIAFYEPQKYGYDSNGCVLFSVQESFDAQMDALWPTFSASVQSQIIDMGFMDKGLDGNNHFHSSPRFLEVMTGNGSQGNSIPESGDAVRNHGCLPFKDLPFDSTITEKEYFAPVSQNLLDKALAFRDLIGGKEFFQYHWLTDGGTANRANMQLALPQAPLVVGIAVDDAGYNQATPVDPPTTAGPEHAVMVYKVNVPNISIYDHYEPRNKTLDAGYPVHYVWQGVVNPLFTPLPPLPAPLPNPATNAQIGDWLSSVSKWLQSILNAFQGRNNLSSNTMTKTLSLVSGDYVKALVMSVIAPVLGYVFSVVQSGSFMIDWHQVGLLAATAGIGYIIKQLGTSTTVVSNAPVAPVAVSETVMGITLPSTTAVSPSVLPAQAVPPPVPPKN